MLFGFCIHKLFGPITYATCYTDVMSCQEVTRALLATGRFEAMTPQMDEDEHSIEMHLPFIQKVGTVLHALSGALLSCRSCAVSTDSLEISV